MNTNTNHVIKLIKKKLKGSVPNLTKEEKERRNRILNSEDPEFKGYGHKMGDLEHIAKGVQRSVGCDYVDALEVFRTLIRSKIHEEKFMGVLFLNRFKKDFDDRVIKAFEETFRKHCDTWALCDSSMIKVLGPFLAKKREEHQLRDIVDKWSNSGDLWIRRASIVIYLKNIMIKKEFDEKYLFEIIERFKDDSESYIEKAVAWLLRTCARYKPNIVYDYLKENKDDLSRLIVREGSKKLSKNQRTILLEKN